MLVVLSILLLLVRAAAGQSFSGKAVIATTGLLSCGPLCDAALLDTYANIAASTCNASVNGQLAYTTDSIYTARCNGSTWDWFFRGIKVTPPPTTGWTLEAAAGATETNNADGTVTFYFPPRLTGAGTDGISGAYRTGSNPQTITALMCAVYGDVFIGSTDVASVTNDVSDSLGVRDSAGKYSAYFFTVGTGGLFYTSLDYWTTIDTFSSAVGYPRGGGAAAGQLSKLVNQDCHWFRLVDDSSNHNWYYNYTGSANNWLRSVQKSRTDFLATGVQNPAVVMYTHNVGGRVTLVSWLATNP